MAKSLTVSDAYIGELLTYVQRWEPPNADPGRVAVLVPGGAHTGVCWTTTPDGRPGWAHHLLALGWTVLVMDWPGTGRSPAQPDSLPAGPDSIAAAIAQVVRQSGPVLLIGHSMGASLAVKALDEAADLVTGFLAVNPAPLGTIDTGVPLAPDDAAMDFYDLAPFLFGNADRFPSEFLESYRRTLCGLSPSVFNSLIVKDGWPGLASADQKRIRSVTSMVIAGDADQLATQPMTTAVAEYLGCKHVTVGADWGLHGYGHLIPVEEASEQILHRALDELNLC